MNNRPVRGKEIKSNRVEIEHVFDNRIQIRAVEDHILESHCRHVEGIECQVCKFEHQLGVPQLPEMIFANNSLSISLIVPSSADGSPATTRRIVQFNAYDALKQVQVGELPDIMVKPSTVWQEARKDVPQPNFQKPFDWTYTSFYRGTPGEGVRIETTDEAINYEKLKRRDPIVFYAQMTLYEDELADHGCSQMNIRIRVMPTSFFILCRFYLRVDGVMVRICDTRMFGESGQSYILREWTHREAKYADLSKVDLCNVLDANLISPALKEITMEKTKLFYP